MRSRRPRSETSPDCCGHKIDTGSAMNPRLCTDPEKGYPHIYDHGVEEYDVEDAIFAWCMYLPPLPQGTQGYVKVYRQA